MKRLTAKQQQCLGIIRRVYSETGRSPAIRAIAKEMGVESPCTVFRHVEALVKKGFVTKGDYQYNGIRPTDGTLSPTDRLESLAGLLQQAAEALAPFARQAETLTWRPGEPMPDPGPELTFLDFRRADEALAAIRAQNGADQC